MVNLCPGKKYGYCEVVISLGETRLKSSRLFLDVKGILLLMLYDKIIPDRLFCAFITNGIEFISFQFYVFVGIPLRALSPSVKCEEIVVGVISLFWMDNLSNSILFEFLTFKLLRTIVNQTYGTVMISSAHQFKMVN